ncbi:unnamed protein product [Anisakis simplex]|uniref:Uncharacterized protein n=1 Tax=Anisakis simplex TaxID=6269 RepID=A0A3P6T2B8_ANISI|nr:unnamed protein product [Anisakis simplex]
MSALIDGRASFTQPTLQSTSVDIDECSEGSKGSTTRRASLLLPLPEIFVSETNLEASHRERSE